MTFSLRVSFGFGPKQSGRGTLQDGTYAKAFSSLSDLCSNFFDGAALF